MTKLQEMAFDAADEYCKCVQDGYDCVAGVYSDGYESGFKAAYEILLLKGMTELMQIKHDLVTKND